MGNSFLQDISLFISNLALFKHLVYAKVPFLRLLVVLEWSIIAYFIKFILKVLPFIVILAFFKGILSPSCSSFATLQYLEDFNFWGLFDLVVYFTQ
jgi:hypothetical protein